MTTHAFTVRPGVTAPVTAADVPLTNIRPSMEPVGPIKTIMDALTGTYDVYERARIAQTWFDLYDLGIFEKADVLTLYGRTQNDCLINWAEGPVQALTGGAYSASYGIALDGVDDWIDTGVNPTDAGWRYSLNSAAIGLHIPDASTLANQGYTLGRLTSGTPNAYFRTKANSLGTQTGFAVNGAAITVSYSGPFDGVWLGNRLDNDSVRLMRNGALVTSSDANTASALPNGNLVIGRQSTSFGPVRTAGWYVGAGFTTDQEAGLTQILTEHFERFAA